MANTGRYVFKPMAGRIHHNRPTIAERVRHWWKKKFEVYPDMYPVTGYCAPIFPSTKK